MKKFKEQKAITLVALVITIIILLILAGVALSIVFNGGIIEKSQNAVDSYNYSSKNEEEKLSDLEEKFTQLYNERVAGKEGGSGEGGSGEGTGGGSGDSAIAEWTIVTDYGATGLSLGDIVKPINANLGNESFYVIGKDDTEGTVTLLAQYCVNWNSAVNAQDSTMGIYDEDEKETTGTLAFRADYEAANANVYSASDIKEKVDAYASKLVTAGLTLEDVEVVENGTPVAGIKGRLMWGTNSSGEVQSILGSSLTNKNDIVYGPTGAKLNYWLGSPLENYASYAWRVSGISEYVNADNVNVVVSFGLRPVIKVLQSNF